MKTRDNILDHFDPRQCIASKVMKSHRIINGIFRRNLKQFDLSNSQMSILFVLSKKKSIRQNELAEILFLEKSSISRNLKRLFDRNFLSKGDRQLVEITEEGLTMVATIVPFWNEAMQESKTKLGEEGLGGLDILLANLTQ